MGNFLAPTENVYSVSFLNIGKEVANDVHCGISFSNERIINHSYLMNPKPLESMTTESTPTNSYEVTVKYLNQDQGGSISVQTQNYESPAVSYLGIMPMERLILYPYRESGLVESSSPHLFLFHISNHNYHLGYETGH